MSNPEFSRPINLDTVGETSRSVAIEADAEEKAALARRFDLVSLQRLASSATLVRQAAGILVEGRVRATAVQRCVATDVTLPAVDIDEPFKLLFVHEVTGGDDVELNEDELDRVPLEGGAIDLGEAAAETLALALDPYPRASDAEAALREAGVKSEDEASPFGVLAALRDKLSER